MNTEDLKTQYARDKEARELAIYQEYNKLLEQPGAMRAAIEKILMEKYNIHSTSTIWQIRKRVEKRLEKEIPDKKNKWVTK